MNKRSPLLSQEEIQARLINTPKIDVQKLLKQGYKEAKSFHCELENGCEAGRED